MDFHLKGRGEEDANEFKDGMKPATAIGPDARCWLSLELCWFQLVTEVWVVSDETGKGKTC